MHPIHSLRQKQADLAAEGERILKAQFDEGRAATKEEDARQEQIEVEYAAVTKQIDAHVKSTARLRALGAGPEDPREVANVEATGGFRNMVDFARAVKRACTHQGLDDRLVQFGAAPSSPHSESGPEGFMVPPQMRDGIWNVIFEDPIVSRINFEPTSSSVVSIVKDQTTPWGAAGIVAYWVNEGAQLTASKLVTEKALVQVHKLAALSNASDEILEDAPLINSRLTLRAGEAIAWKIGEAVMNGDGAGKPLGWFGPTANGPCLVTQTKETSQTATTFNITNSLKMMERLLPASMSSASTVWFANNNVLSQFAAFTIGNQPVFTPVNEGAARGVGGFLWGKPILFSEHCATMGTVGDVQLVDLDGYYATQKQGGVQFATSIHLYFDYMTSTFRWSVRIGGQPLLSSTVAAASGAAGATKSHFVCLETRS